MSRIHDERNTSLADDVLVCSSIDRRCRHSDHGLKERTGRLLSVNDEVKRMRAERVVAHRLPRATFRAVPSWSYNQLL